MMPVRFAVRALRKFGLLDKLDINVPMRLSGHTYRVPMIKGMGFIYVIDFEPFMDELIRTLAPRFPGVFVDCGVNLGQTLIKAKAAFPDIDYVGFEPNPACVAYTRRVIALNDFGRVRLIDAGLTDTDGDGELVLWTGHASDPSASLLPDLKPSDQVRREIPVKLMAWATVERTIPIGRLGFVKIDVEGSELAVLEQLAPRLRSDRPIVSVEVLPPYDPPFPGRLERQRRMEDLFRTLDLKLHRIHHREGEVRLEALDVFGSWSSQLLSDHLLIPAEREAEVVALFA